MLHGKSANFVYNPRMKKPAANQRAFSNADPGQSDAGPLQPLVDA